MPLALVLKKILFYLFIILCISVFLNIIVKVINKKKKIWKLNSLLKNGNFLQPKFKDWSAAESTPLVENELTKEYLSFDGSRLRKIASFNFKNPPHKQHLMTQFLLNIPATKSPLLLTFSHILYGINKEAKIYQYSSIRYRNGSILPIWNFVPDIKDHKELQRECIIIPHVGQIENIISGFGGYNFNASLNEKTSFAGITDVGMYFLNNSKVNQDDIIEMFASQCDRIRKLKRSIENNFRLEIDKFKAAIRPVIYFPFFLKCFRNQKMFHCAWLHLLKDFHSSS